MARALINGGDLGQSEQAETFRLEGASVTVWPSFHSFICSFGKHSFSSSSVPGPALSSRKTMGKASEVPASVAFTFEKRRQSAS